MILRYTAPKLFFNSVSLLNKHCRIARIYGRQAAYKQPDRKRFFSLEALRKCTDLAIFDRSAPT